MPFCFFDLPVPVACLILFIGSVVLWAKTKQAVVLVQLIACSFVLFTVALETLANYLIKAGNPALFEAMHRPHVQVGGQIAVVISFIAFPVGYLWYAITQKRIQPGDVANRRLN